MGWIAEARGVNATRPLGVIRPETQAVLDKLRDVPVDIAPHFPAAAALLSAY
jgi:hypothetical protein